MKCCFIADLHGYLPDNITSCEVVFICGDISPLDIQGDHDKCRKWFKNEFKSWAESLPCDKVIFIAGNHDRCVHKLSFMYEHFPKNEKVTYLFHESYVYTSRSGKEYRIFGTPYCKQFGNWAFMENDETLTKLFSEIPVDLDILITHDAPYGCSDICLERMWWNNGEHIGNVPLREAILDKAPKIHVSGHLHSASREWTILGTTNHTNCSIMSESYTPIYDPIYCEI